MMTTYIARGEGADRYEKIPVEITESPETAVKAVAKEIAELIRSKAAKNETCVLGLATGSSPIKLYKELVRMHKEEGLSFKNVITFNLDEYFPMAKESEHSYHYFMHHHLFDHIDIDPKNIHIPDGTLKADEVEKFCKSYEQQIENAGGIDLQILGIGRTGHIGFNEPGSPISSKTRMVYLDRLTMKDAADEFDGIDNVPTRAITMGVGTIMKAQRVILLAWGEPKAPIIKATVEGEVTDKVPATFLQIHPNVQFFIDEKAAEELTRANLPWLVSKVEWNDKLIRKAVIWLCQKVNKPILKVEDKDYADYGMSDLVKTFGSSNKVNIQVFNDLQHTITGWPGGKPNADDSTRPERANPYPKRVIIFSPHPDDDVISMGGTFARLVEQGHDVHVAYETSGNIAVLDDYIYQQMDIAASFTRLVGGDTKAMDAAFEKVKQLIANRKPGDSEPNELLPFKGALRRAEARGADRYLGVPEDHVHFLNLPFYETGTVKKNPLGQADVDIIVKLLREIKPHQIYAAGDLADPHGTHGVCLDAILRAYDVVCDDEWFKDCYTWWYRGAWMEWEIEKVDMAVPISPSELSIKRKAIYKHGSQNNGPAFPGDDPREFWQRAEDRNRNTADIYNKLGMAEYEAMEVFARYIHKKKQH
ncbi:glucosamine-6-phosphate deaminase [Odoribacter lunatus]|uniref:glucosamine-6-phosphate deaminase n=1 Tax=Odoribacter lunatus TaxID=2941335 RepID=UPI00203AA87E|nr:glucosamine-6-phosphate deaminase [Odoribacter lunatus]